MRDYCIKLVSPDEADTDAWGADLHLPSGSVYELRGLGDPSACLRAAGAAAGYCAAQTASLTPRVREAAADVLLEPFDRQSFVLRLRPRPPVDSAAVDR